MNEMPEFTVHPESGSGGGGGAASNRMWAITPDGQRMDEDANGNILNVPWGSVIFMIGGGGGGGGGTAKRWS